ncbi:MAG: hypothetical protein R2568_09440 [Candidatus Scalindua sp.]|nr:hypothetical protein [Candidatus Scalindua sp.]
MRRKDGKINENQIVARVTEAEKRKLIRLAKSKGCDGWTGLVRLLAYAKEVNIKL